MVYTLLPPRGLVLWRLLLVASLALVTYASLARVSGDALFVGVDKLSHCLTYASLYVLAYLAFPRLLLNWSIHFALLSFGVLIEILQAQTNYRSMEAADVLANITGTGLGNLMLSFWLKLKPGRFD